MWIEVGQDSPPVREHLRSRFGKTQVPHIERHRIGTPPLAAQQHVSLSQRSLEFLLVGHGLRPQLRREVVEVRPAQCGTPLHEIQIIRLERDDRDLGENVTVSMGPLPVQQDATTPGGRHLRLDAHRPGGPVEFSADHRGIGAVADDGFVGRAPKRLQDPEIPDRLEQARLPRSVRSPTNTLSPGSGSNRSAP